MHRYMLFFNTYFALNPVKRHKKGAEVRRRGVKFNTSARGFVLFHTRVVRRSSFSGKNHKTIFKKFM